MSNAKNARATAAAATAAAEKKRRVRVALTYTGLVAALLIIVVVVAFVVRGSGNQAPASTGLASTSASASTSMTADQVLARDINLLTGIPQATYDKVGPGTASKVTKVSGPALTQDGKPVIVYVGGEFCPFCAGERWALIAALSRFGTWHNLGRQSSSASDVYPSTSTFTFHGASYTSAYVVFSGTEALDGNRNPLDTPPARDNQLWTTIGQSSFPFLDLGGTYAMSGAQFQPTSLHVNASDSQSAPLSWDEIATALGDPASAQSQQIIGAANILTAEICTLTNNKPANVCSSAGVAASR